MIPQLSFAFIAGFFILFAISRAVLRFIDGSLSMRGLIFWFLLWIGAGVVIIFPVFTGELATYLGIQRGTDAVVYIAIIVLYYLIFRIYISLNTMQQEITELIRRLAIKQVQLPTVRPTPKKK